MSTSFKQIARINFLILLAYTIILHLATGQETLFYSIVPILIQVGLNLLAAVVYFIKEQSEKGKAYLLCTFLVLLIGFGTCWMSTGIASSWDKGSGTMFH